MGRIATLLVTAVVASLTLGLGSAAWGQQGKEELTKAANKLQPSPDWQLVSQQVQGPSLLCIGDVACPSLARQWRGPADLSTDAFTSLIASSGWQLTLERDCEPRQNGPDAFRSCSAYGRADGYEAQLYYESSGARPATGTLQLFMR